jgi:Xylose isomerase-like TIM barrel
VDLALLFPAEAVGVVVDTYHVWWDVQLAAEIARAAGRIVSYQVCDWVLPLPADVLLGRGHLGDGVIDFGPISDAVTAAGYKGYVEVEIFNHDVWAAPPDQTAATVRERFPLVSRALLGLAEDLGADRHGIPVRLPPGGDLGDHPAEPGEGLRHRTGIVDLFVWVQKYGSRIIPVPPSVFCGIRDPVGSIAPTAQAADLLGESLEGH